MNTKSNSNRKLGDRVLCDECESANAHRYCPRCDEYTCEACFMIIHRNDPLKRHKYIASIGIGHKRAPARTGTPLPPPEKPDLPINPLVGKIYKSFLT